VTAVSVLLMFYCRFDSYRL